MSLLSSTVLSDSAMVISIITLLTLSSKILKGPASRKRAKCQMAYYTVKAKPAQ